MSNSFKTIPVRKSDYGIDYQDTDFMGSADASFPYCLERSFRKGDLEVMVSVPVVFPCYEAWNDDDGYCKLADAEFDRWAAQHPDFKPHHSKVRSDGGPVHKDMRIHVFNFKGSHEKEFPDLSMDLSPVAAAQLRKAIETSSKPPAKKAIDFSESDEEAADHSGDCTVCGEGVIDWEEGYICTGCGECLEDNGEIDVRSDFYKKGKQPKGCTNCGASLYKTKKTDGYCDNCETDGETDPRVGSKSKKQGSKRKAEAESDNEEEEQPKKQKTASPLEKAAPVAAAAAAASSSSPDKKEPVDVLLVHFNVTSDYSGEKLDGETRLVKLEDLPGKGIKHGSIMGMPTVQIEKFLSDQFADEPNEDEYDEDADEKESLLIKEFESYPFDSCYRVVAFTEMDVTI